MGSGCPLPEVRNILGRGYSFAYIAVEETAGLRTQPSSSNTGLPHIFFYSTLSASGGMCGKAFTCEVLQGDCGNEVVVLARAFGSLTVSWKGLIDKK